MYCWGERGGGGSSTGIWFFDNPYPDFKIKIKKKSYPRFFMVNRQKYTEKKETGLKEIR